MTVLACHLFSGCVGYLLENLILVSSGCRDSFHTPSEMCDSWYPSFWRKKENHCLCWWSRSLWWPLWYPRAQAVLQSWRYFCRWLPQSYICSKYIFFVGTILYASWFFSTDIWEVPIVFHSLFYPEKEIWDSPRTIFSRRFLIGLILLFCLEKLEGRKVTYIILLFF